MADPEGGAGSARHAPRAGVMRGLRAAAAAMVVAGWALAAGAAAGNLRGVDVKKPVYDALGRALLSPVGSVDADRAGIVRLDLATGRLTALPAPCGIHYQALVLADGGKLLAAVGSRVVEGREPGDKPRNKRRFGFAHLDDLVVLSLPDGGVVHRRRERVSEYITDVRAPGAGGTIYLSVDSSQPRSFPSKFMRGLDVRSWREAVLWPSVERAAARPADYGFLWLSAPLWFEQGRWVLGGYALDTNPRAQPPKVPGLANLMVSQRFWLLDPVADRLTLHPDDDVLRFAWGTQRVGDLVYFAGVTKMDRATTRFTYGLKLLQPDGTVEHAADMDSRLGYNTVFDDGQRQVAYQDANGALLVRVLGAASDHLQLGLEAFQAATPADRCGTATYFGDDGLALHEGFDR